MMIRQIKPSDNPVLAQIIRASLEEAKLALPGTAYFDASLDNLSEFYLAKPGRCYFVIEEAGQVLGGAGVAEFDSANKIAELQKLYLTTEARGQGLSKLLLGKCEQFAQAAGYHELYLESHHNLQVALQLYERMGYRSCQGLAGSEHSLMDRFFVKELSRK